MSLNPDKRVTQYSVQILNMTGGMPGNSVYAIRQTRDGYLWIGTGNGLARFDGLDFKVYTADRNPALKSNAIRALYEDRDGSLWIGTGAGGLTRYREEQFTNYPITIYKALENLRAINQDRWGNLWVGSFTEGLTCIGTKSLNPASGGELELTTYTAGNGIPHNQVRFISKDSRGDLWVAVTTGIVKVEKPGVFREYASPDRLPYIKTTCLYEPGAGNLWIGTGQNGLFRLQNGAGGTITPYGTEAGLAHPTITYLYRDRMENTWIGTDGGGLTRMRNGEFRTLPGGDILADGYVYSIYEDREGSLWLGTLDGGLHQLIDNKFTTFTTREGLVHDYVQCIYPDRAGRLWVGTKEGLNRMEQGKITAAYTTGEGLAHNNVIAVCEDPGGELWIGTWGGLQRLKPGKTTLPAKIKGLSDNRVTCIAGDRRGNTWIGTRNGLNRYNRGDNTFTVFTTRQGLCGNAIETLYQDSRGSLRIGTNAGLNTLKDGKITAFNLNPGHETGNNPVQCIYQDREGTLWYGTYNGLIREPPGNLPPFLYDVGSGLIENHIYSILEDEKGYLWLGGRSGISRVKKVHLEDFAGGKIHHLQPETYSEMDGMKSRWCTGMGCKTRDGRFWFPTAIGMAMIDPNHIKKNNLAPSLIIEKLIADGESIKIKSFSGGPGGRFFKKAPLAAGGILKLSPGKKRLEFYYTALSFINPQKIKFKIKLEGYDRDWVEMGNLRTAVYTGLSPGKYTLTVTAGNSDGVWNRGGVSFSFYMRPHWYKTWWAITFYVLTSFLGIFFFVTGHSRKLKREKQRLEGIVAQRTLEINRKNLQLHEQADKLEEMDRVKSRFFANISHEFRTPLTLIMGPLEQILGEDADKEMKTKARLMLRNSRRLLNLVNQLLDLAKFDNEQMKLRVTRQNIVPLVRNIVMCFESLAQQNKVELLFKSEEEDISLYLDPEKLEKMITNLLANAFNYTPAGGKISVLLRKLDETLGFPGGCVEISVRDTGSGIPAEQLPSIFDRFYRGEPGNERKPEGAGIGLALTKELIGLHHGEIDVRSRVGKSSGTEFMVRFPLAADRYQAGEIVDMEKTGNLPGGPGYNRAKPKENGHEPDHEPDHEQDETGPAPAEPAITTGEEEKQEQEKDIILVVEDNADVRGYICGALEPQYIVKEAVDGKEGIKTAGEIIPDLVISDVMMPGIDGYEVCRRLKQDVHTSHIPIIILTAKASEESILTGLATRADDYIIKPFNTNILKARIRNLIELRRQMQMKRKRQMALEPAEISVTSTDETFYKELQGVIEANLDDPDFNVEAMSKKLYMNRATLYRKVHALTGETPTDFIRSYRLKRAAQLLKAKVGNVTEVSFRVGFSNSAYFTKCFKDKFHRVPSDFIGTEEPGDD